MEHRNPVPKPCSFGLKITGFGFAALPRGMRGERGREEGVSGLKNCGLLFLRQGLTGNEVSSDAAASEMTQGEREPATDSLSD